MNNHSDSHALVAIAFGPALVLLLHIVATVLGWYESNWWFDIPMHFVGGIAITISSYYVLKHFEEKQLYFNHSKILQIIILLAFTGLATVCWELMEYSFDTLAGTKMQGGMLDTTKDLCLGLMGGGLMAILLRR